MLAAIRDYLYAWQFIHLVILAGGWLGLGSWMLQRALAKHGGPRRARMGRCVGITLLAGLAGGLTGMAIFHVVQSLGGCLNMSMRLPAALAGAIVALVTAWLVIYAMLETTVKQTLRIAAPSLVVLVALIAVLGGDAAIRTRTEHRREIRKAICRENMTYIYHALLTYQSNTGDPIGNLESLAKEKLLKMGRLACPGRPANKIGYFYLPGRIVPAAIDTHRILVCDLRGNHPGGRNVMLANSRIMWESTAEFQLLLGEDENKEFAAALKKAEGP